ncbi:cytochrome P450 [Acidothermaceae bacterium B102]|nr:cytochrome P450 [Acidothermaceae bacterium B102]
MSPRRADRRWIGPTRLMLMTRRARRDQDAGAILRRLARGADTAVGLTVRGRRVLLVLDPQLAGELLARHAADTVKGPGVQLTRDLLGEGLLTSEGDDHRRARRLVAPAFSPRRLEAYATTFATSAAAHADGWRDGQRVDMAQEMATLTLAMVSRTLLGIDLADQAPEVRADLEAALARFGGSATQGDLFGGDRHHQPQPRSAPAVHQLVDRIIEERRRERSDERGDVISALLTSSEAGALTDAEVHDHVMTLLMAGHETTANALTWTWHLLAAHPVVAARLHAEADALGGRTPAFADVPALTYARAVISEAMRLYPPAWIVGRTLTADLTLAGYDLPAGSLAAVSPLLLHHDPRWFPDPEAFDPERWLDERRDDVPRYAYLPFGTGPRACIGEQFAWIEAIITLTVLASRWSATAARGPVTPQYRVTLRPAGGLEMTMHARR